jgi:hypothetical protein
MPLFSHYFVMPSGRYCSRSASTDDSRLIEYEIKAFDRVRFVETRREEENVRIEERIFVCFETEMRQAYEDIFGNAN